MLQVINHLSRGTVELSDFPCPSPSLGAALIRTHRSLVSVGIERMLVDFGRANLIEKARQQPDKVRQVLDKAKADGLVVVDKGVIRELANSLTLLLGDGQRTSVCEAAGCGVAQLDAAVRSVAFGPNQTSLGSGALCAREG